MLRIGEFSRLSRVTVKTLRFYDELGLLKPAKVDAESGYRYYSPEQLLTVKRISALKEQGFTLEQIVPFLREEATAEDVKASLLAKRAEMERQIREAERQLQGIEGRLRYLDRQTDGAGEREFRIREVPPMRVASVRDVVPRSGLCLLLDEVSRFAESSGEGPHGAMTIIQHAVHGTTSDEGDEVVDIEVAVPITADVPGGGRAKVRLLPGIPRAASCVHRCDPYASSCSAVSELISWIAERGETVAGSEPIRELYLTPDRQMYGNRRRAELLIPLLPL